MSARLDVHSASASGLYSGGLEVFMYTDGLASIQGNFVDVSASVSSVLSFSEF